MTPSRYVSSLAMFACLTSQALSAREPDAKPPATAAVHAARRELQTVLRLKPHPMRGEELYRLCSMCHDHDAGLPKGWVPGIAGQHARVIMKQLVDFRHGLRWDVRMQIMTGRHVLKSSQDIADVASYVAGLTQTPPLAVGSGEELERGRALYEKRCLACHGRAGEGSNARLVPRLAGQDYNYLLRQLHDAIDGRRPELEVTHQRMLKPLDAADLEGLADHLSRFPLEAPAATEPVRSDR